ncbi:DUF2059 domain-containing protein [Kiloniella sp.]|uniref:DUF2059 domain-containing protein n=1 Tax=Kiloniella sp. TaxID=1938587 RepID=UPI003B011A0F
MESGASLSIISIKWIIMKKLIILSLLTVPLAVISIPAKAFTQKEKQAVDELLLVTGEGNIGKEIIENFIPELSKILKDSHPSLDDKALYIVEEEIWATAKSNNYYDTRIKNAFYKIYYKHLTLDEVEQLIEFYRSPLGKKTLEIQPHIEKGAFSTGEKIGRSMAQQIVKNVIKRLKSEGYEIN